MPETRLNLTTLNGPSLAMPVPTDSASLSVHIDPGTWGTAVAALQWSAGPYENSDDKWHDFDRPYRFGSGRASRIGLDLNGVPFVRLKTLIVDTTADNEAKAAFVFSRAAPEWRGEKKVLAQLRPTTTAAQTLYSPAPGIYAVLGDMKILNTDAASARTYSLYLDVDGSTYDGTTQLVFDASLAAKRDGDVTKLNGGAIIDPRGNVGVSVSLADTIVFTLYGTEY